MMEFLALVSWVEKCRMRSFQYPWNLSTRASIQVLGWPGGEQFSALRDVMNCMIHIISAQILWNGPSCVTLSICENPGENRRRAAIVLLRGISTTCSTRALMFLMLAESIQNHQKQQPAEISWKAIHLYSVASSNAAGIWITWGPC